MTTTVTEELQLWRCAPCLHSFYRPIGFKQAWYRRLFRKPDVITCPICGQFTAKQKKIVTRTVVVVEEEFTDGN